MKACLNGRRNKSEHPNVPVTLGELARDSRLCFEAGVGAVHFHPRDAEGKETLEPRYVLQSVEAIRRACSFITIGVTTGEWIHNGEQGLNFIRKWGAPLKPDFASVNFSEAQALKVCELLDLEGIGIEAGLSSVEDAKRFVASDFAKRAVRVLVEIERGPYESPAVEVCANIVEIV